MNTISIGFCVASAVILLLFIVLFKHINELIKDEAQGNPNPPYSLGRSLLFYWTVIVIFSICYLGITQGAMPILDDSVLLLMGIVVGTSGTARVIDYVQIQNGTPRHQEKYPAEGWLMDIISDKNGLSIHRFQTVLFNIIYGIYFLSYVFGDHQMPVFSSTVLALLGISSGTYALLKIPENSPADAAVQPAAVQQATQPQYVANSTQPTSGIGTVTAANTDATQQNEASPS